MTYSHHMIATFSMTMTTLITNRVHPDPPDPPGVQGVCVEHPLHVELAPQDPLHHPPGLQQARRLRSHGQSAGKQHLFKIPINYVKTKIRSLKL